MDRYWVGGSGNWSDNTNHWSASSGGSPGASLPTSADNVFIDSNSGLSGGTLTLNTTGICSDFTSSVGSLYTLAMAGNFIRCSGSLTLEGNTSITSLISSTPHFDMYATSLGKTISTNGNATLGSLQFLGVGGSWTLQSDLVLTNEFYQENGTFDANNFNVTVGDFYFLSATGFTPTVYTRSGKFTPDRGKWTLDQSNNVPVNIIDGAYSLVNKPFMSGYTNVAKPTGTNYTNVPKPTGVFQIIRGMYMGPLGLTYSKNYVTDQWIMVLKPST